MSFNTALTSGQKTLLRSGGYAGDYLLYCFSNRVVFAGQFNSETTTPKTWAQFNYNNVTVGAYTDIVTDQVLLAGNANDISQATFRGRIRKTPTNTIIYCNESSQDFIVGTYFWVIDTFEPQYKLSRPNDSGVQLVDYDVAFTTMQPVIVLGATPTAGPCDSGTSKLRIAFNASGSYAATSGATIVGYQYSFPSATVISGALNTSTVTVDATAGEQWGQLVVTDSNGITQTRHIPIFARDVSHASTVGFDALEISGDLQRGWTLTAPAFSGVDSLLPNTFCMVWRENEQYNGTIGALETSNTLAFIGWFNKETDSVTTDPTNSIVSDAKFEVTGVSARMARLAAQLLPFEINASPAVWGDITSLTPWRAIVHFLQRYSTILNLCDLTFDSVGNTYVFPEISNQGGNVYSAVQGIAQQINANVEFAPDGRIQIYRDAAYLTVAERALLTDVIDYVSSDVVDSLARDISPNPSIGIVDADGAVYSTTTAQTTVFTARAPGHAQGEAQGTSSLPSQILATADNAGNGLIELRNRVGQKFTLDNLSEQLTTRHNDGYCFLIPSHAQLFTFTLATTLYGANNVQRIVYDNTVSWLLESVRYVRVVNTEGFTTEVEAVYRRLGAYGDPGDDTTSLAPGSTDPIVADIGLPAFNFEFPEFTIPDIGITLGQIAPSNLLPPKGRISSYSGQELIVCDDSKVYWLSNVINLTTPQARLITPYDLAAYLCRDIKISPFFNNTSVPGYMLASDGTNSAVWVTKNAALSVPIWIKGADQTGVYTLLKPGYTFQSVLAYQTGTVNITYNDNFSGGLGSKTKLGSQVDPPITGIGATMGSYTSSGGRGGGGCFSGTASAGSGYSNTVGCVVDLGAVYNISAASFWQAQAGAHVSSIYIQGFDASGALLPGGISANFSCSPTYQQFALTSTITGARYIRFASQQNPSAETFYIDDIAIVYSASNGNAQVIYSVDDGSTFAAPLVVGASSGVSGGFDVQRSGAVSYAGCTAKVRKATTLGGAYSDWYAPPSGDPVCIIIPYYKRNSTTLNTTTSTPDCVVATTTGNLYWVDGASATATDITPTGFTKFDNPNCVTVSYGHHIACFGQVGGLYKLARSTDGGSTWTIVKTITNTKYIRGRRNDIRAATSGTDKGQLYLMEGGVIDYSSKWMPTSGSVYPRNMPVTDLTAMDTVY